MRYNYAKMWEPGTSRDSCIVCELGGFSWKNKLFVIDVGLLSYNGEIVLDVNLEQIVRACPSSVAERLKRRLCNQKIAG